MRRWRYDDGGGATGSGSSSNTVAHFSNARKNLPARGFHLKSASGVSENGTMAGKGQLSNRMALSRLAQEGPADGRMLMATLAPLRLICP